MTDFTPTREAVEAVAKAQDRPHGVNATREGKALDAIAAFVEAEGFKVESRKARVNGGEGEFGHKEVEDGSREYRRVGPWRERD